MGKELCLVCGGTGRAGAPLCPHCKGSGERYPRISGSILTKDGSPLPEIQIAGEEAKRAKKLKKTKKVG